MRIQRQCADYPQVTKSIAIGTDVGCDTACARVEARGCTTHVEISYINPSIYQYPVINTSAISNPIRLSKSLLNMPHNHPQRTVTYAPNRRPWPQYSRRSKLRLLAVSTRVACVTQSRSTIIDPVNDSISITAMQNPVWCEGSRWIRVTGEVCGLLPHLATYA